MRRREFIAVCGLTSLTVACRPSPALAPEPEPGPESSDERVLEEGRSEYNHVIVTEEGALRRMYFETGGRWLLQSTYDLDHPDSLHHEVFQTMASALLLQPEVGRVCMIGVGGGQLSNYLFRHIPGLEIDVVDICPEVIRLARAYFGVPHDDPRYRLHVADGRVFIEGLAQRSVDLLILDAFRGHSIPKHLRTREFFAACAARLAPGGVVIANMHRLTPRYPIDRATMASVFSHSYRFASADDVQTSVVSTMSEAPATPELLLANARQLQPRFDIDLSALAGRCLIDEDSWDPSVVLHDDFEAEQLDEAAQRHNLSCTPKCAGDG